MYTPRHVIWYYKRNGLNKTVSRLVTELKTLILAVIFAVVDLNNDSNDSTICVIPRRGQIDQDTVGIITQHQHLKQCNIFIAVSDTDREKSIKNIVDTDLELVEINSLRFIEVLSKSRYVFIKDRLWQYWSLSGNSTKFIRISHGIASKDAIPSNKSKCGIKKVITQKSGVTNNYTMTVASQAELNRKAGIIGISSENLAIYGYPRYDRVRHLINNPDDAVLTEKAKQVLNSDTIDILYAPTHKDGEYETTLFPFPDFDQRELEEFLEDNNIRIFIRLHTNEEDNEVAERHINGDTIRYSGTDFSRSAIETMPYFDALITDYSSIYLDYVLFDQPMFFVQDNIDEFRNLRGFAFDYNRYWPGPKIETQKEFLNKMEKVLIKANDEYQYDRKFVTDTFHPPQSESFLTNVLCDDGE